MYAPLQEPCQPPRPYTRVKKNPVLLARDCLRSKVSQIRSTFVARVEAAILRHTV